MCTLYVYISIHINLHRVSVYIDRYLYMYIMGVHIYMHPELLGFFCKIVANIVLKHGPFSKDKSYRIEPTWHCYPMYVCMYIYIFIYIYIYVYIHIHIHISYVYIGERPESV